jgi:hypothetical protein
MSVFCGNRQNPAGLAKLGTWYTPMEFAARLRFMVAMDPKAPRANLCTSIAGSLTGWRMPRRFQHANIALVKMKWHVVRHSTVPTDRQIPSI